MKNWLKVAGDVFARNRTKANQPPCDRAGTASLTVLVAHCGAERGINIAHVAGSPCVLTTNEEIRELQVGDGSAAVKQQIVFRCRRETGRQRRGHDLGLRTGAAFRLGAVRGCDSHQMDGTGIWLLQRKIEAKRASPRCHWHWSPGSHPLFQRGGWWRWLCGTNSGVRLDNSQEVNPA
jgi:hypothetical protein